MPEHYQFTLEWETSERANALEQAAMEGESPVANLVTKLLRSRYLVSWASTKQVTGLHRVGLLESAALIGWYTSSKAK
jgi:hypothetical protein